MDIYTVEPPYNGHFGACKSVKLTSSSGTTESSSTIECSSLLLCSVSCTQNMVKAFTKFDLLSVTVALNLSQIFYGLPRSLLLEYRKYDVQLYECMQWLPFVFSMIHH